MGKLMLNEVKNLLKAKLFYILHWKSVEMTAVSSEDKDSFCLEDKPGILK